MRKPKLQTEEKYAGDFELGKILALILLSDTSNIEDPPFAFFKLLKKGINYEI